MQDFNSKDRARYFDGPLEQDEWDDELDIYGPVPTDEDLYRIAEHEDTGDVLETETIPAWRNVLDQGEILLGDTLPVHYPQAEWRPVWVTLSLRA